MCAEMFERDTANERAITCAISRSISARSRLDLGDHLRLDAEQQLPRDEVAHNLVSEIGRVELVALEVRRLQLGQVVRHDDVHLAIGEAMDAHALDFGEEGPESDEKAACAPRVDPRSEQQQQDA